MTSIRQIRFEKNKTKHETSKCENEINKVAVAKLFRGINNISNLGCHLTAI